MTEAPIVKAIRMDGGQAAVSRAIGRAPAFVWQISRGIRPLPPQLVIPLEVACGGAVTRHELRPDVFGSTPGAAPGAAP